MVEYFFGGIRAEPVVRWLDAHEGAVHSPALVDAEVAQVLRRLVAGGIMTSRRGRASIEILGDLPVTRHSVTPLLPRVWQLRHNLTAYDATYVALAEALGCSLVTYDAALGNAPGVRADVQVLGA